MKESTNLIIGAGIVGSSIALELSKRSKDEKTILIDAHKISSQTSKASSKMLHGGIRYLENFDIPLVFEALKEKNYWIKRKPHLAKEAPFYLPTFKESKYPLWIMKIGVFLYDLLSFFKNKHYPNLSKNEFTKLFPMVRTKGLKGAAAYSDAIIDDELFTIEIANEAKELGVEIQENNPVTSITFKDDHYIVETTKEIFKSKRVIIAAGPFTDKVVKLIDPNWQNIILPSKGVHLWIKKSSLPIEHNMVLQTKDGRIIFIINHKDRVLLGTTETVLKQEGIQFNLQASQDEINYILNNVNEYLKAKKLSQEDIINSFSGIRPLIKSNKDSNKTSRHHKIYTPKENLYIIAGGKYTTCRVMAKDLTNQLKPIT